MENTPLAPTAPEGQHEQGTGKRTSTAKETLEYMAQQLGPITFNPTFTYERQVPSLVNDTCSGTAEIIRWMLDRETFEYDNDGYAPSTYNKELKELTGQDGLNNTPVYISNDALVYGADSLVQFFEQRLAPRKSLVPENPKQRAEVLEIYKLCTGELEDQVSRYTYSQLLPERKLMNKWVDNGLDKGEADDGDARYRTIKKEVTQEWGLDGNSPGENLEAIRTIFKQMDERLADGRKYLTGNDFTLADVAFAAVAARMVLPKQYGGAMMAINEIPDAFRREVFAFRQSTAGQFILRVYIDERPVQRIPQEIPDAPNSLERMLDKVGSTLGAKKAGLFALLGNKKPVLNLDLLDLAVVSQNSLVKEMLEREEDFTVEEINGQPMSDQNGAFYLGMDKMNPQMDRERDFVMKATKREDVERIRGFVRAQAAEITESALPFGRLDVPYTLNEPVLIRLLGDYFGVPAPTEAKMKHWQRVLFYDLFLNLTHSKEKHYLAVDAATERRAWVMGLIKERKAALARGEKLPDNLLNRFILQQREMGDVWYSDNMLRRNIGGLLTGIQETTSKAVVYALDELFRQESPVAGAIAAAKANDMETLYGYVSEALRFHPVQPGVLRYAEDDQVLGQAGEKQHKIPGKTKILACTAAAMFDETDWPDAKAFNPDRYKNPASRYMNWGYGPHECYGKHINPVTITELVAAVLRLPNVRRAEGITGTGLNDGPFPNNFVVAFDAQRP